MDSLNNPTYIFNLPDELLGKILHHLNLVTGSKNFVNRRDIPFVMKYVRSLVCTSSWMNQKINYQAVTASFLESLSDKYGQSSAHFAAVFNTPGARKYLWNYIKEVGDDKNFQIIQEIYDLASTIFQDAKKAGLDFDMIIHRGSLPKSLDSQTQEGFVLYNAWSKSHLLTPFGKIDIYYAESYSGNSPLSVSEMLIKNLKGTFENLSYTRGRQKNYLVSPYEFTSIRKIGEEDMTEISVEGIESNRGSKNFITTTWGDHYSIYNIHEVNGKRTPAVKYFDSKKIKRSKELIDSIWKMLRKNKSGLNPVEKEIKKVINICNRKSDENQISVLKNIHEVTKFCIDCIIQLDLQPIFKGESWHGEPTKLLVMENHKDASLIDVLNESAIDFLKKDSYWQILPLGPGNNIRYLNEQYLYLDPGIELLMDARRKRCDINALKTAYELVLKNLSQNWQKSEFKNYPHITYIQSEEEYDFFVKTKGSVKKEKVLILSIANKLGISDSIHCHDSWEGNSRGIYLWIKKDKVDKVLDALNIQRENRVLS